MSEQDNPTRTPGREKKTEPLLPVLVIFAILVLTVAAAGIFFFSGDKESKESTSPGIESVVSPPAGTSIQPPAHTEKDKYAQEEFYSKPEQETGVVPGPVLPSEGEDLEKNCIILADKLHGFFVHLDSQEYIKTFNLEEPSQEYFTSLAYRLLDNPPVVSRESDDLYTILKNMAHFFRVIGKDNIILIKTILDWERDKIEDVAAELYLWSSSGTCEQEQFSFAPSLAKMYEYAGFFLNTMGGRSYLFRRDSRSRLVVNYYSILLIDQANEKEFNNHGIDITLVIPQLIEEIESSNQLIYKENYLDQLYALLEKYQ